MLHSVRRDLRAALMWLLRLGLAAVFIYAGAAKLIDVHGFALDIANYRVLPSALVAPLSAIVPGVEIACGACLLAARTAHAAAWLTAALLAVFTAAVAQALARGINLDCGCFGASRAPVTMTTLVRDIGLLAAAGTLVALERREQRG
ncbi:MAG: MauE/DoxX family redox-associated membrane protein [Myxococcota bacterium]